MTVGQHKQLTLFSNGNTNDLIVELAQNVHDYRGFSMLCCFLTKGSLLISSDMALCERTGISNALWLQSLCVDIYSNITLCAGLNLWKKNNNNLFLFESQLPLVLDWN